MTRILLCIWLLLPLCLCAQTRLSINTGTTANDGTGDSIRSAFNKINTNFTTLWTQVFTNGVSGFGTNIVLSGNTLFDGNLTNNLELGDIAQLTLDGTDTGVYGVSTLFLDGGVTTLRGVTNLNLITPFVYAGTATNGQFLRLSDAVEGTVEFADASDSTKLPLAGGTMTGDINLGERWVTNAAAPIHAMDVATVRHANNRPNAGITATGPVAAPVVNVTTGISISDPAGTNPPIWLDYQTLLGLLGGDTNAPASVGGLAAWYQADTLSAGAVASWPDVSGNSRDATQGTAGNRPVATATVLNGKTVVRFTKASAHYLQSPTFTALAQPNTIFVVAKFASATVQNEVLVDGESQRTILYAQQASINNLKTLRLQAGSVFDAIATDTSWHIFEASANGNASEIQLDGGPIYGGRTLTATGMDRVNIGVAAGPTTSFCLDGDIAEIIVFDKGLSRSERARVRRYLAHKWGFPTVSYSEGGIISGTFTYASSKTPAYTNLFAAYAYPAGRVNLPIVTHMHGWVGTVSGMAARNWVRQAGQGAFVVVPAMRGQDSTISSSAQDGSGFEIHDIHDAVNYVRTNWSPLVNTNLVIAAGYSGGGGNVFNYATRFPDTVSAVVSHFGITDYGFNSTWGWYYAGASPTQQTQLVTYIGDPATLTNRYRARASTEAYPQNFRGHTYFFHDEGDTSVSINQSLAMVTNLNTFARAYTTNWTKAGDAVRWLHSNPNDNAGASQTEAVWLSAVVAGAHRPWLLPASGTLRVNSWLTSRRGFSITLGAAVDEVADVSYDTATRSYTVTPLTAPLDFTITQGSGSVVRTNISTATTVTVP